MSERLITEQLLAEIVRAAPLLHGSGTLSEKAIRAMARHLAKRPIQHSTETGCGASTLLFSHLSGDHTVFTLDDGITPLRSSPLLESATTRFVVGSTQKTLAKYEFRHKIQAALLDGPHAFPFPQLEYYFIYPSLDAHALLILDDIHIPSIHDLFRFLRADAMFDLVDVVEKTAFFERSTAPTFDPLGDGWWLQNYNRRVRFRWKERVKALIPSAFKRHSQQRARSEQLARAGQWFVSVQEPSPNAPVGSTCMVRGSARIPPGTALWLLARRQDQPGWWPQGSGAIDTTHADWSQACKLGEISDVGFPFDLLLLVTRNATAAVLERWIAGAKGGRPTAPLPLPAHADECPPVIITVRKMHHDNPEAD